MTLHEQWEEFLKEVLKSNDKKLIRACRRAFYAGAFATLGRKPRELMKEISTFADEVGKGEA